LRFLSAEALMSSDESEDMSMLNTGSLCPYSDRKNFSVSMKNTCHTHMPQIRSLRPL
jgi:hypothetical protein